MAPAVPVAHQERLEVPPVPRLNSWPRPLEPPPQVALAVQAEPLDQTAEEPQTTYPPAEAEAEAITARRRSPEGTVVGHLRPQSVISPHPMLEHPVAALAGLVRPSEALDLVEAEAGPTSTAPVVPEVTVAHAEAAVVVAALASRVALAEMEGMGTWQSLSIEHEGRQS